MTQSLKDRSLTAMLWVGLDKLGGSVVNFAVTIILARLLAPEDFGIIAMVMIFFEFSVTFVDSGFSAALIREKTISEADKSTTFIFNFIGAIIIYLILFFCAPYIAAFFGQDILVLVVRILGLSLIIESFVIVQQATLTQQIDFKTQAKVRVFSILSSGGIAVLLALKGFGVYSLLVQILVKAGTNALLLWWISPWRPSLRFDIDAFKKLFGFGSKILLDGILEKFFEQLYKLLIGKFYAAATLGFFIQAAALVNLIVNNLFWTLQKVVYPVLAKLQDDLDRLRRGYSTFIRMASFIIFPAMIITGVLAESIIVILFGQKWLPSAPFVRLLCVAGLTNHFTVINGSMFLVLKRPELILFLSIFGYAVTVIAILIGFQFGVYGLVVGKVVTAYLSLVINTIYSYRLLKYSLANQIADSMNSIICGLMAGILVFFLQRYLPSHTIEFLALKLSAGCLAYLGFHLLIQSKEIALIRGFVIPQMFRIISKTA
jgi:O-antigen/teichoic acid export membrane protein